MSRLQPVTPTCEVFPRIWVGPDLTAPGWGTIPPQLIALVLCAKQRQVRPPDLPGAARLFHCPLTDDAFEIASGDVERCEQTARMMAAALDGATYGHALFTCVSGQNRSSWVAGRTAIMLGHDPAEVIERLEQKRDFRNWFFKQDLRGLDWR